jgi:hypothetical protein
MLRWRLRVNSSQKGNTGSDGPSKGNEYAIEALKQVLVLAGAILALTITFLKDALGDSRAEARLQFLIPISWTLLLIVIWTAWITLATAARKIGTSSGAVTYVFAKGETSRFWALVAQFCFGLALTALGMFAIVNFPLYFRQQTSHETKTTNTSGPTPLLVDYLGRIGPFELGSEKVLEAGTEVLTRLRAELNARSRSGEFTQVLLIGSADKFELTDRLRARYGSNAGLARARADWVAEQLLDGTGQKVPHLVLTVGPLEHGTDLSRRDTAPDRSVGIYLLWTRK